jgi:hypothetical protein
MRLRSAMPATGKALIAGHLVVNLFAPVRFEPVGRYFVQSANHPAVESEP